MKSIPSSVRAAVEPRATPASSAAPRSVSQPRPTARGACGGHAAARRADGPAAPERRLDFEADLRPARLPRQPRQRFRDTFEPAWARQADVARLHAQFLKIDRAAAGPRLWEMLDHLDLHRTKFAKRVFSIFDEDGSNEIDFREFVVTLWQRGAARSADTDRRVHARRRRYCTLRRTQLVMFAFDLCEPRLVGRDRHGRAQQHLKERGKRYAANATAVNLLKHINAMNDREYADNITVDTFTEFVRTRGHAVARVPHAAEPPGPRPRRRVVGPARARASRPRPEHPHPRAREAHLSEKSFHKLLAPSARGRGGARSRPARRHADFSVDWRSTVNATGLMHQRRKRLDSVRPRRRVADKALTAVAGG
ncbi:Ca2-binding protein [Aureococcus anophagefferens]|nr:Ca2-binding protein [Aureococcus anophagefferens]